MPMSDSEEDISSVKSSKLTLKSKLSYKSKPFFVKKDSKTDVKNDRKCSQDTKAHSDEDEDSSEGSDDFNRPSFIDIPRFAKAKSNFVKASSINQPALISDEFLVQSQVKRKTELCKNWQAGDCKFGSKWFFAHGVTELSERRNLPSNYKTKICKQFHEELYCSYGPRCQFIHLENAESLQDCTLSTAIYSLAGLSKKNKTNRTRLSVFTSFAN